MQIYLRVVGYYENEDGELCRTSPHIFEYFGGSITDCLFPFFYQHKMVDVNDLSKWSCYLEIAGHTTECLERDADTIVSLTKDLQIPSHLFIELYFKKWSTYMTPDKIIEFAKELNESKNFHIYNMSYTGMEMFLKKQHDEWAVQMFDAARNGNGYVVFDVERYIREEYFDYIFGGKYLLDWGY